jgi:ribosomal protection tetracycline resistance protein
LLRTTLNLGILAHVDAGKTTLSERLLHAAGVIREVGRVDDGTTLTDSMDLERQRGITIRSAVAALSVGDTSINLIDTPGHPDFIAEVDRVLGVLDGAVLVISAVEGVQPQTRLLMRALRRRRVPTLLFLNKVDRRGADVTRALTQVERRLAVTAVPMSRVERSGRRDVMAVPIATDDPNARSALIDALALQDERLIRTYVEDESRLTSERLQVELAAQTRLGFLHPVYAGSAVTGTGIEALMAGLVDLLPRATGDVDGPVSGSIFKIERNSAGEKVAYARMFSGTVRLRDRVNDSGDKVSAIRVFECGAWVGRDTVVASEIAKLWGLRHARIGDVVGQAHGPAVTNHFALPTLETVVEPVCPHHHVALRSALSQLAEQDPLIDVRTDDTGHEVAVSLYGEIQKEIVSSTLATEHGLDVVFRETTPLYMERPRGRGQAMEVLNSEQNPFRATIGLLVAPARVGSGIAFELQVDFRSVPLFVFRNLDEFGAAMHRYVVDTMREGLYGWPVSDCLVTMTDCTYSSPDGPPATRGPLSTAADFRKLTPLVLMRALDDAGTVVCEPLARVSVEAPVATLGPVLSALGRLAGNVGSHSVHGDDVTIDAVLPAVRLQQLHRMLPGLTNGEGTVESHPAGHRPIRADPPSRRRTTISPLSRQGYLSSVRTT